MSLSEGWARHIRLELRHDGICPSESVLTPLREVQLPNVNVQRMNPAFNQARGLDGEECSEQQPDNPHL